MGEHGGRARTLPKKDKSWRHEVARTWARLPVWAWGAIALVLVIVIAGAAAASGLDARAGAGPAAGADGVVEATSPRTVKYEVYGTASSVSVDVQRPTGAEQVTISLPLMERSGAPGLTLEFEPGTLVYVSAQNQGADGTVTCRITIQGTVVSTKTADGARAFATCEGRA